MPDEKKPQVFLSYASENLDMVRKVYDGLVKRGLNVWFDKEHLRPGKWKPQIERAIRRSRYFIICLSNAAIRKTGDEPGFQDHELNEAYNIARDQSEKEFAIVPVRLEDCDRGDHRLTLFQQYDLFKGFENNLNKLSVHIGGISLSDPEAVDERVSVEKLIDNLMAKAGIEFLANRLVESLTLITSVLVLSPNNLIAWNNKGLVLLKLREYEKAIQAYEQAVSIEPKYVIGWINKGIVFESTGRYEEAILAFNQALTVEADNAFALAGKGFALDKLGKHREAIQVYDQAVIHEPDNPIPLCQ